MKVLVVEDDLASRKFLQVFLSKYGVCDVVVDGLEALDAFLMALRSDEPYDLVCLDVMMPKVDGMKVLKTIRELETQKGLLPHKRVKVIMTTALTGTDFVKDAFVFGCEAFATKPIDTKKLLEMIEKMGLIKNEQE